LKDIYYLTRQILRYRLERHPDAGEERSLVQSFFKYASIYVVADPDTTQEEWDSKTFGIATVDRALRLYLNREDAVLHAESIKAVLPNGTIMVMKTTQAMAKALIDKYFRKGFIDGVWLCGKAPICAKVNAPVFIGNYKRESPSTIMSTPSVSDKTADSYQETVTAAEPQPKCFALVDEVRNVLNMSSAQERRRIDPGKRYENFDDLLTKLVHANDLDPSAVDQELGLPSGSTNLWMNKTGVNDVPKDTLVKYLNYFGLLEFLYEYKSQCPEIQRELAANQIDQYKIEPAGAKTEEVFTLRKIKKGKRNGINIYSLELVSEERPFHTIVSSKFKLQEGAKYQVAGLAPQGGSQKGVATTKAAPPVPQDQIEAALAEVEKKARTSEPAQRQASHGKGGVNAQHGGRGRGADDLSPEEKMEKDREVIIGYLCKKESIGAAEAKNKIQKFFNHPKALSSFAKFAASGIHDSSYSLRGYNPRRLINELHYGAIEAYYIMIDLESNLKETQQRLKYRETDPQYQKHKPQRE